MKYSEYLTYLATEGIEREKAFFEQRGDGGGCYVFICNVIKDHSPIATEAYQLKLRRTISRKLAGRVYFEEFGSSSEKRAAWLLKLAAIHQKRGN